MNDYDRKFLSRLLRAEKDCLTLARQEKDEQSLPLTFHRAHHRLVAALLQEARIEIITLRESLDDARAVIQKAADAAQSLAPFVLAYRKPEREQP